MARQSLRVVAALVRRGDEVLLQQRPAHKVRGGAWELPGGKVEAGESDEAALRREWREELGVDLQVGGPIADHAHDGIHLFVYQASLQSDAELVAHDGQLVAWIALERALSLPLCAADRVILAALTAR